MPAYFILVVWAGVGVNAFFDLKPIRHWPVVVHYPALTQGVLTIFTLVLMAYWLAWPNWQQIYRESTVPLDEWWQLLRGSQAQRLVESSLHYVAPHSLIYGDWEQVTPFEYYRLVNGQRPDVTAHLPLDNWPQKVAAARAQQREFYMARKTPDLIGTPYLSMAGPLIHVQTGPNFNPPANITPANANFEDELELIGYRTAIVPQNTPGGKQAGNILQLTLFWRAPRKLEWDYALSLRLVDAAGQEQHKRDAAHPVLGSYPTSLWTPAEVVADFYELPLAPGRGALTLHLLPYRTQGPGQWHNLQLTGSSPPQEGIRLGPFGP
jgi:hypothetical protein